MNTYFTGILTSRVFNQISLLLIDIFALWLVFRVFSSNPKKKLNRLFSAMTALFLVWINGGYFFAYSDNLEFSLVFGRLLLGVVIWSFVLLYFFLKYFPKKEKELPIIDRFVVMLGIVFSALSSFTGYIVEGVRFTQWGIDPLYAPYGKFTYYLAISFLIALALFQILRKYPGLTKKQRRSVQLFFFGTSFFLVMNLIFNVLFPIWRDSIKYWQFGNYSAIVLIGFAAYSIVEKELLDIKVIATEAITLTIWTTLLIRILTTQSFRGRIIDVVVLLTMVVFGVFLIRSVSKEVEQREKMEELTSRLKALDKQKDEFISMAAHEIRAPMTALKGYISMVLEGDAGDITEKARGFLADANAINERLIRLVNNMLNVTRIEEGRMVFQLEEEELSRIVRAVYSQFIPEAERKGLEYELKIPNKIKDKVMVDPDRIQEVIGNMLSNAVKYTDQGSVEARLTQPDPKTVRFEVEDTGPGISKDEQRKLFQKFYRAESNVGKTTGTGLGLYISKLLVDRFNGKIGVDSQPGKGSTFWFELPLVKKRD